MFGQRELPKTIGRTRTPGFKPDIEMPCPQPQCWAHMGRAPDTDHHIKAIQFKQTKIADFSLLEDQVKEVARKDQFSAKFDKHSAMRRFKQSIAKRVDKLEEAYEKAIEVRREKLKEMLAKEEREFYWQTVDEAQRGGDSRNANMKNRAQELKAKREAERLEIVKEKRLQQYKNRCTELRDAMSKKSTIESKNSQLQQIRENEARRGTEREYDRMWHEITKKEMQAKKEREEHDALKRFLAAKTDKDTWLMQIRGKDMLKEEVQRLAQEDLIETERMIERMRKEEMEALEERNLKKDQYVRALAEDVSLKRRIDEKNKRDEEELERAMIILAQIEVDKDRAKVASNALAKKEMERYMESMQQVKVDREEDEKERQRIVEEHVAKVQREYETAQCKILAAREKLKQECIKGIAEQKKYKIELAENELKRQRIENETLKKALETNRKLVEEAERQEVEARKKYQSDLLNQIQYNKLLQERERQELERQVEIGRLEEERYFKLVEDVCGGNIKPRITHPFRKVLEQYDCHCVEPNAKNEAK